MTETLASKIMSLSKLLTPASESTVTMTAQTLCNIAVKNCNANVVNTHPPYSNSEVVLIYYFKDGSSITFYNNTCKETTNEKF